MELDITCMLEEDLMGYSASRAELGEDVGRYTWNNAINSDVSFVTEDNIEEIKDYIREFGAWDKEEIDSWDINTTNALVIQFVSDDLRQYLDAKEGTEAEFAEWNENCGGRVYECDIDDHSEFGKLFYYIGI